LEEISLMKQIDSEPWYKQFWPWFLITIPVISMILSITMLNLALNTDDSLVIDDYYKQGKAINLELSKVKRAKQLDITTILSIEGMRLALEFTSGQPSTGEALKLAFFHPTLEHQDFSILLTQDASGVYRGVADIELNGKWKVTLSPLNNQWKIVQDINLPRRQGIIFNP